ncbi:cytochrome P450 [Daedaleopsis nitida]|nr:cytochrome P450 [Daedaleopsis nitida]
MSLSASSVVYGSVAAVLLTLCLYVRRLDDWRIRSRGRPLPPGPPALPILGNLFHFPNARPWIGFRDLCSKYGDIVHLKAPGTSHVVILGSAEVINEYLEKRTANTSDRMQTCLVDIIGAGFNMVVMRYGQQWREHRRVFWEYFHPTVSAGYRPIQRAAAHRFLYKVLTDPTRFKDHIRYGFSVAMMKLLYGNDDEKDIHDQMEWLETYQDGISQGLVPGKFLVEFFPFLQRLPSYFLGPELRAKAVEWRGAGLTMKEVPYARVKEAMVQRKSEANTSIIGKHLSKVSQDGDIAVVDENDEDTLKNVAVVTFEGGADTMFSSIQTTFLAMSLHPHILKLAQAELDAAVGPNRLPDWDDRGSLPYVNAIIRESLRWMNVTPLSMPHCTTADDELHGYFIPAGTLLVPNTWACMHDPDVYEDPDSYRPERFLKDGRLDPSVRDPSAFIFGYGRRICPGRYFAEAALFINTASLLHVFDITPPVDEDGNPVKIVPQMSDGLVS